MTQIVILCGGKGRRMRNLSIYPKPLIKISKKPILKYLIDFFLKNKLTNIILATGHKSKKVENFVSVNYKKSITCINSGNVDILERLKKISNYIHSDFIICYGDTLADIDIKKLKNSSKKSNKLMTVTLAKLRISFGIAEIKDNKVTRFVEKPVLNNKNIGFFYCKKQLKNEFFKSKDWISFLKKITKQSKMGYYIHNGEELTVNTPDELVDAKEKIKYLKI